MSITYIAFLAAAAITASPIKQKATPNAQRPMVLKGGIFGKPIQSAQRRLLVCEDGDQSGTEECMFRDFWFSGVPVVHKIYVKRGIPYGLDMESHGSNAETLISAFKLKYGKPPLESDTLIVWWLKNG